MDGDRTMTRSTATGKPFGKSSTMDQWTLVTDDWMYTADLTRKKGSKLPNFMPVMAREWDALDKDQKKRAWQNMQEMAELVSRASAQADSANQAATQAACEVLKNLVVGKAMADAADAV